MCGRHVNAGKPQGLSPIICPLLFEAAGGADWSPYFGDVDEAKVKEAHALALSVVVWTVNERKDIERMLAWKVDGIIGDYPDRVLEILIACGFRVR